MSKGMVIAVINKNRLEANIKRPNNETVVPELFNSIIGTQTQLSAQTIEIIKSFAPGRFLSPNLFDAPLKRGKLYEMANKPVMPNKNIVLKLNCRISGINAIADKLVKVTTSL